MAGNGDQTLGTGSVLQHPANVRQSAVPDPFDLECLTIHDEVCPSVVRAATNFSGRREHVEHSGFSTHGRPVGFTIHFDTS
jgi:hypothetical protein